MGLSGPIITDFGCMKGFFTFYGFLRIFYDFVRIFTDFGFISVELPLSSYY